MTVLKGLFAFVWVFIAAFGCTPAPKSPIQQPASLNTPILRPKQTARNIIFMIGDGMGLSQVSAGMYRNGNRLFLEQFPIVGLHKAYAKDNLITDSAAGATAFASGVKTNNGAIGVDADGKPVVTILEEAEKRGLATGMVVTSTIVHATPAAFAAHVASRNSYEDIAADMTDSGVDLLIGGGKKYFDSRTSDNRNLLQEFLGRNYIVSDISKQKLTDLVLNFDRGLAFFTADGDPLPVRKGRDYLVPASKLAVNYLSRRSNKGFFLMIEGSQIDWGGHAKDASYMISEMIEFDEAIGAVLEFAKENGQTLIVVTGDHETGGFSINQGSTRDSIVAGFSTDYHTGTLIPVFAFGPGAELFGGIYENNTIYDRMKAALGW